LSSIILKLQINLAGISFAKHKFPVAHGFFWFGFLDFFGFFKAAEV
jgi:hypothetical protein